MATDYLFGECDPSVSRIDFFNNSFCPPYTHEFSGHCPYVYVIMKRNGKTAYYSLAESRFVDKKDMRKDAETIDIKELIKKNITGPDT